MIFNISKTQTTLTTLRFMDKLVIHGGNPLQGNVKISGAKNAVLPIMASSLLVDGITGIRNVPDLRDTKTFIKLLEILGAKYTKSWPLIDKKLILKEKIKMVIQINGKTRDVFELEKGVKQKSNTGSKFGTLDKQSGSSSESVRNNFKDRIRGKR